MKKSVLTGVFLLSMALLSACGQKGALYLPAKNTTDNTPKMNEPTSQNLAQESNTASATSY